MSDVAQPGYLVIDIDREGTCVGGLMVTDENGLPLDFRFTDPITPTRLQKALYGGALDRYLRADVVAGTLLSSIEARPTVIFVDDDELLDLPAAQCPVARVVGTSISAIGSVGTTKGERAEQLLLQASETGSPLRVMVSDESASDVVHAALVALSTHMDALEPADRVRHALALIAAGELT